MNTDERHLERVQFLQRLRPMGFVTLVSFVSTSPKGMCFEMPQDLDKASAWAYEQNQTLCNNVYFVVNPTKERMDKKPRKTDMASVNWLHLDLDPDVADGYEIGKAKLPERLTEIKRVLGDPSVVLNSGNGLQVFYELEDPLPIAEGEKINKLLVERFGGDSGTFTADRLMRFPGTLNFPTKNKISRGYSRDPVPASILELTDRQLSGREIDKALKHRDCASTSYADQAPAAISVVTKDHINDLWIRFTECLSQDPPMNKRWAGDTSGLADTSGSGKDMSLMSLLSKHGFTLEEAAVILDAFEFGSSQNKKPERRDRYYWRMWDAIAETSPSNTVLKSHMDVVHTLVSYVGQENLFYHLEDFWQWEHQQRGVWSRVGKREIKNRIQNICAQSFEGKLTKSTVDSVVDLLANHTNRARVFLDQATESINVLNGELHFVDSGWELRPHNRENYATSCLPVTYDPKARAPRFTTFMKRCFVGAEHSETREQLCMEMMGYSLIPSCRFEKFILLYGTGANGKSVFLNALRALVGFDQVSSVQLHQLREPFMRAELRGKRVNIVSELSVGNAIADGELKALVSGEAMNASEKYKPPFQFRPTCTLWVATNHLPRLRDYSKGMIRRIEMVEFPNEIPLKEQDKALDEKLSEERSGILNLALEALARAYERGSIVNCPASAALRNQWLADSDQVQQFIADECVTSPGSSAAIADIYQRYKTWVDQSGIKQPLNKPNLGQRLDGLGYKSGRGAQGTRIRIGIELRPITPPAPSSGPSLG